MRERACLEAAVGGAHLVGAPAGGDVAAQVGEPEMRSVELVRRADEDVDADRGHVDRAVRAVVDRVDPGERSRLVRERCDLGHRRDGADRVRGPGERDHPRALGQQRREVVDVEPALVVDVGEPDREAAVACELEPRRDVAVVVEPRADDLVAFPPLAPCGAGEREAQRRHVGAEEDLVGRRAEERRGRVVRRGEKLVRAPRRRERPAEVGVRIAQARRDRVDHRVGHLGAARPVEEGDRLLERREARADGVDRGQDTRHSYLGLTWSDAPTKQSRSPCSISLDASSVRGSSCASMVTSISTKR